MNNSKIRVLLLTYYWPPAGGPGVQRWLKFTKYLVEEKGFNITVITPRNPTASNYDPSLNDEISDDIKVYGTESFEPFRLYNLIVKGKKSGTVSVGGINLKDPKSLRQRILNYIRANYFIPDARKGWNYYIIKQVRKLLKSGHHFDVVISTGPPHSTHLAALKLKNKFGIKWIADFRDPWINIYYNSFFPRTAKTKKKDKEMEDMVLRGADMILAVSPGLYNEFRERAEGRMKVLFNGFDDEDIPERRSPESEKFIVSYTGNFKPNQNVETVWKAFARIINESEEYSEALEIHLVGNADSSIKESIRKFDIERQVLFFNYVPHHEATDKMVNSNLLLFIVPQAKGNESILTGKLFEYLGSGTPILPIGPVNGNAAQIIAESKRGNMINYEDEDRIYLKIKNAIDTWLSNDHVATKENMESVMRFSRKGAALELADMIEDLSQR